MGFGSPSIEVPDGAMARKGSVAPLEPLAVVARHDGLIDCHMHADFASHPPTLDSRAKQVSDAPQRPGATRR